MTGRLLWIELRRSNARWMALIMLPALLTVGAAGRGLTVQAIEQRQALMGAFPLAMGLAAWHARRDRRSRTTELISTTARPRWHRVWPAASALAVAAIAAYLVACAVNLGSVVWAGGYLSVAALPIIVVGAVALLVPVAFGLAIGRWLPFVLVPPLLVWYPVATLFFGDTEAWSEAPGLRGPIPGWMLLWGGFQQAGTEFDIATVAARVHQAQALWLLTLAGAGFIAYACRPRTAAAAVPVILLGAIVAVQVLPERYVDAYRTDPGAMALSCTTGVPRICLPRVHRTAAASMAAPARDALTILAARVPDPPTTVLEVSFGRVAPRRADTVPVYLQISADGRTATPASGLVPDLRWELLLGAGTPPCPNATALGTAERRRYDTARLVAAAWLLGTEPPEPPDTGDPARLTRDETLPVYRALRALPAAEQRSRVAALRAAELACTSEDRVDLLTGAR